MKTLRIMFVAALVLATVSGLVAVGLSSYTLLYQPDHYGEIVIYARSAVYALIVESTLAVIVYLLIQINKAPHMR